MNDKTIDSTNDTGRGQCSNSHVWYQYASCDMCVCCGICVWHACILHMYIPLYIFACAFVYIFVGVDMCFECVHVHVYIMKRCSLRTAACKGLCVISPLTPRKYRSTCLATSRCAGVDTTMYLVKQETAWLIWGAVLIALNKSSPINAEYASTQSLFGFAGKGKRARFQPGFMGNLVALHWSSPYLHNKRSI